MCRDSNGVPEFGWQLGYFQPARVEEVVKTPWCSPFLGGIKLQNSAFEVGRDKASDHTDKPQNVFMDSHYFSYPIFQLLNLLMIPSCAGDMHQDIDLLNMTEIDPLWSNDFADSRPQSRVGRVCQPPRAGLVHGWLCRHRPQSPNPSPTTFAPGVTG